MVEHEQRMKQIGFYRAIAGNGWESWSRFVQILAPDRYEELHDTFNRFTYMKEASVEHFSAPNETSILYLPWKAPISTVEKSVADLERTAPHNLVILSHDYLTTDSLDRDAAKPPRHGENEAQIALALDHATRVAQHVTGYFGHVGMEYGPWAKTFNYGGKMITAKHADERAGMPLILNL
jgi:hypothetical protein